MSISKRVKKVFKWIFGVIMLLFLGFVGFVLNESKDEINADFSNIEERLNKYYDEKEMAGFAVSVFNADSVLYSGGIGFYDLENRIPFTKNTLQYIASVSKTTIGVSLMKGQEMGLFSIDDPINNHLPFQIKNPHFPEKEITIRHLATHTSSMDYNEKVVESVYVDESEKLASLDGFMRNYFENGSYGEVPFTKDAPGENFNYSNIASAVAAYIIELKSGMSFADFSEKNIFSPLKMNDSYWFLTESDSSQLSKHYEPDEASKITEFDVKGVSLYPARDLITNVTDLTKYCQAVIARNPKLLTPESYETLLNPSLKSTVTNRTVDNTGIFWMTDRNQYGITYPLTGMTGGDNCINTIMLFDPATKMGFIFLGNTGGSKDNRGNHIWIYRTLVSLGDHVLMNSPNVSFSDKMKFKFHNWYSRINGLF